MFQLSAQAWLTRRAAAAALVILEARQQVAQAAAAAEEAEAELALHRRVRAEGPEASREFLGRETEVERLLLERERLRRQRLSRTAGAGGPEMPALTGAVEREISDREIEAHAVRAVARYASLSPPQAESWWAAWRRELPLRLPAYAAAEVARRAEELRDLAR